MCSNEHTKIDCVGQLVQLRDIKLKMLSVYVPSTSTLIDMDFLNKIDLENTIVGRDITVTHQHGV